MKIKIRLFVLFFVISLLCITLLSAIELEEMFDSTNSKGIDADLENNIFTFSEAEGALYLIGTDGKIHTYSDIIPRGEGINSFIKTDLTGSITDLDLTAAGDTSIYLNGVSVPLAKGSRAVYKEGNLEVTSNSDYSLSIPRTPNNLFESTPKTITYKSLNGANIKLSKDYTLKEGSVVYSLEKKEFSIPKGEVSVLNDFNINAHSNEVILNKNIRFSGTSAISQGSGFKVNFNSGTSTFLETGEVAVSLRNARNGEYYQVGDSSSDVIQIQKIVGMKPTGKYDEVTKQAVAKWQAQNGLVDDGLFGINSLDRANSKYAFDLSAASNGKYFQYGDKGEVVRSIQSMLVSQGYLETTFTNNYGKEVNSVDGIFGSRTLSALKEWQSNNNLNPDGQFGKDSAAKAKISENNVIVSMLGGSSVITNGKNGLDISMKGKTSIEVGGESYYFDGKNLKQGLWSTLQSNVVSTPTKITFEDEKGKEFELSLDTAEKKIGSIDVEKAARRAGLKPDSIACSGTTQAVCSLMIEKEGGGFSRTLGGLSAQKAGVIGPAWGVQKNIIDKGGKIIYTKEKQLTPEQKDKIAALERIANSNIEEYMKQGLSQDDAIKKASNDIRSNLGAILNHDQLSSQVSTIKGDVISMYYRDSNYLSEALTEGSNEQKNTHVGIVVGSTNEHLTISSNSNILRQLKSKLADVNENSLYVNSYSYVNEEGNLEPIILQDGKFYLENGKEMSVAGTRHIIINRPQIAQQEGSYKVEYLDEVLSKDKISLYGVTRPKYTDYLEEFFNFPDAATVIKDNINCQTLDCDGFSFNKVLQANSVPNHLEWTEVISKSTLARQKEFNLPNSQLEDFEAMTSAIIKHETSFGESIGYKIENLGTSLGVTDVSDTKGYMNVNKMYIEKSAQSFSEETPDLKKIFTNKEESIKYGQRYLAEIFNIYAPEGERLDQDQLVLIAAAYNSGQYTPRDAALQQQLSELGYYIQSDDVKLDGKWGPSTEGALINFAKDNGIPIQTTLTADIFDTKAFESTALYKKIKQKYYQKTNQEPEYAIIPNIKKPYFSRTKTIEEYSQVLLNYYKNFCPSCT